VDLGSQLHNVCDWRRYYYADKPVCAERHVRPPCPRKIAMHYEASPNNNSLPHVDSIYVRDLHMPSSNDFTLAAHGPDLRLRWLHSTTLLLETHDNSLPHDDTIHLRYLRLPSSNNFTLTAHGPFVWSCGLHCPALLLATDDNSLPHDDSIYLRNLHVHSSNEVTPAAAEPPVWSRGLL